MLANWNIGISAAITLIGLTGIGARNGHEHFRNHAIGESHIATIADHGAIEIHAGAIAAHSIHAMDAIATHGAIAHPIAEHGINHELNPAIHGSIHAIGIAI